MQSSTSPDRLKPTPQYVRRIPFQDVLHKTELTPSFRQEDPPIESESHGGALAVAIGQVTKAQKDAFDAFCQGSEEIEVQPDYRVMVFSDSDAALDRLRTKIPPRVNSPTWDLVYGCIEHYEDLERLGAAVTIHLVPGHQGVPGNHKADSVAYALAHRMANGTVHRRQRRAEKRKRRSERNKVRRSLADASLHDTTPGS